MFIGGCGGQYAEPVCQSLIFGVIGGRHKKSGGGLSILQAGAVAGKPVLSDHKLHEFDDLLGGQHMSPNSVSGQSNVLKNLSLQTALVPRSQTYYTPIRSGKVAGHGRQLETKVVERSQRT